MSNLRMKKRENAEVEASSDNENLNQNKKTKKDDSVKKQLPLKNLSQKASSSFKSPLINRRANKTVGSEIESNLGEKINSIEELLKVADSEIVNLQKEYSIEDLGRHLNFTLSLSSLNNYFTQ